MLGADGYGAVALAAGITLYLTQVVDFGIEAIGIRDIAEDPSRTETLGPAILGLRLLLASVVALLNAAVALSVLPSPEGPVLAAYGLLLFPVALSTKWIHIGHEKARPVALARMLGEIVMVVLVLALVREASDLVRVPLSQFAGDILAAGLLLFWLRLRGYRVGVRWNPRLVFGMFRRAWPLVAHALLGLLIYNSDLIFIRAFESRAAVGYYAVAYTLISFLLNLGVVYMNSLLPTLTRQGAGSDAEKRFVNASYALVFAVGLPTAIGGSLLAGKVIETVFGSGYSPAVTALQILIWSIPISLFRNIAIAALIARDRPDRVLSTTTGSAVLNILLNVSLIPLLGINGAAWATVATEAMRTILAVRYARNEGLDGLPVRRLWKPAIAGLILAGTLLLIQPQNVWLGVALGAGAYLAALLAVGGIVLRRGELPAIRL